MTGPTGAYVTLLRADVEAILAGLGDGSWVCADARARVRSVLADLDRKVPASADEADRMSAYPPFPVVGADGDETVCRAHAGTCTPSSPCDEDCSGEQHDDDGGGVLCNACHRYELDAADEADR